MDEPNRNLKSPGRMKSLKTGDAEGMVVVAEEK
jgi:hypothetical protein